MGNVRDFGAVGDGRRDDTQAIRHAVEEGGGRLVLPRGTYRLTGPVEVDLDRYGPIALGDIDRDHKFTARKAGSDASPARKPQPRG